MAIVVDLETGDVELDQSGDMSRFVVRALPGASGDGGGTAAVGAQATTVSVQDVCRVDPTGDAFVGPFAVRKLGKAAMPGGVPQGDWVWGVAFDTMIGAAGSQGWLLNDGSIRSHIEWGPA